MNFSNVSEMVIKEGRVRKITVGDTLLWSAVPHPKDLIPLMTNTWWISTSGSVSNTNDPNWRSTDKIPVESGATVTFGLGAYTTVASVLAYDSDGKVLGNAHYTGSGFYEDVYHVPAEATHITLTGHSPTNSHGSRQYAVLSYAENSMPPRYYEDELILWCDGIDNTGAGHDETATTWADLSGNGNDLINVASKQATIPAETVQGEWTDNGITINALKSQFVRSVNEFDLGIDRTLELRLSVVADSYAEMGFLTGDRYKFRTNNTKGWFVLSATTSTGNITSGSLIPHTPVGKQFTVSITRHYNGDSDTTLYSVYYNGKIVGTKSVAGEYRKGDLSTLLFGNEKDCVTIHSVRVYSRTLSAGEIQENYKYDTYRL